MERRSHVLVDAGESIVADGAVYQGRDMSGGTRDWTVRLRTCHGGRVCRPNGGCASGAAGLTGATGVNLS